jgi:hypothetical protein
LSASTKSLRSPFRLMPINAKHASPVFPAQLLQFSLDGMTLAAASGSALFLFGYDASAGANALSSPKRLLGHSQPLLSLCFTQDGQQLMTVDEEYTILYCEIAARWTGS